MKRFKISRLAFITMACSMAMLFTAPSFTMQTNAATSSSSETVSPQADILKWVYQERNGNELWKRLYNTTTLEWVGDWIFVGYANN